MVYVLTVAGDEIDYLLILVDFMRVIDFKGLIKIHYIYVYNQLNDYR